MVGVPEESDVENDVMDLVRLGPTLYLSMGDGDVEEKGNE